ncbi:MAG: site-specific integrase [Thermoplasmata archaeon]|nr:site-specific integrase [Thermoplasmata archaeon]
MRRPPHEEFADIHGVGTYIDRRLGALASGGPVGKGAIQLGQPERKAILDFVKSRTGEVGRLRIRTLLAWLPVAASRLGDEFLAPDRGAPMAFHEAFAEYSRSTKETAASCLGSFWRWWFDRKGEEIPRWLRIRLARWQPTNSASDMLTRDDIARIAESTRNARDSAWLWILFNSGCRPGEIYRLRIGDVVPHPEGFIELRVVREKGSAPEPAPVYEDAVPALLGWLSVHPRHDAPDAPIWVNLTGSRAGQLATYRAMCKSLEVAAHRAAVSKPVTPYALRRSRLTMLAKDPAISTSILERVAGWVPGSKVARHYIHLSGKDVIGALNARYGVNSPEEEETRVDAHPRLKCGECHSANPAGAAYCMTCGGSLSLPEGGHSEKVQALAEEVAELVRKPEVLAFLVRSLTGGNSGRTRARRG